MTLWYLLKRAALRSVWLQVHAALERNGAAKSVLVGPLDDNARSDLQGLLALPRRPSVKYRLKLAELAAALDRAESGLTVRGVVEVLVGPVVDRVAAQAKVEAAEAAMWDEARAGVAGWALPWLNEVRSRGVLKRCVNQTGRAAVDLLREAVACVALLPAVDGVLLQVLASECTGDPHALDPGRPVGALVLRAAKLQVGWEDWPATADARRALWAEVGVITEGLSSHVLVHSLRPIGDGMLARHLREHAERGLPRKVMLDELAAESLVVEPDLVVSLVENTTVVHEAARRLGPRCLPLVCLEGVPSVAVWRLLQMLVRSRCTLRVHADFDPAGVRIVNRVVHRVGAQPWHYDAAAYDGSAAESVVGQSFDENVIETPWDRGLAASMRARRIKVFEEHVKDDLLAELVS